MTRARSSYGLLYSLAAIVLLIAAWQTAVIIANPPPYLLPAPLAVLRAFMAQDGLFNEFAVTLVESLLGFLLGSTAGALLGAALATNRPLESATTPLIIALKTTPIIALAPLLSIWLGFGILTKVVLAALVAFLPALVGILQGLRDVSQNEIDLFKSYGASNWQILRGLRMPRSLLHLFAALRVTIVLSVVGAVVAEFAGADSGLGFRLLVASYHLDTATMFVYIFLIGALGATLYGAIVLAERRIIPWAHSYRL